MRSLIALLFLAVAAVAACSPTPPPPERISPLPSASAKGLATLVVQQSSAVGGFYTESAFAYVEVTDLSGVRVTSTEDLEYHQAKEIARVELPAGRYVVGTYVRSCEAACPGLDAPTDACELAVDLVALETVEVRIERRVGRPCAMSVVGAPRCPPRPFDAAAPLGPDFDQEHLIHDESAEMVEDFLAGLAAFLADPGAVDVCFLFTEQGWMTALAFDSRLRDVERGASTLDQDHVLRIAFEGTYDLRDRPPVVPLDIVFDIPAGSTTTDLASGERQTSTTDERDGFHADFVFDGHRWRVDRLGPIAADYGEWLAMPTIPPAGPPCADLIRDPESIGFDENADRQWCDGDGRDRTISRNQLVMLTRYPCDDGSAAILQIGWPLGTRLDHLVRWEYVRDPAGEFLAQGWLTEPFDGDARMPDDAAYSGWTNGNVDLWISPSDLDRAVYMIRGKTVERWPRAIDSWGVVDCN